MITATFRIDIILLIQWIVCIVHSAITKIYFFLKAKTSTLLSFIITVTLLFWNCSQTINYKQLSENNPHALLSIADSLKDNKDKSGVDQYLVVAHNNIGLNAISKKNYSKAVMHFSKALDISKDDTIAMYNLLLCEGHLHYQTGKRDKLWESIQKFYRAAQLQSKLGEPHYYIGRSYQRIGNQDFDLIIESYNKALSLNLENGLRLLIEEERDLIMNREKRLINFWK